MEFALGSILSGSREDSAAGFLHKSYSEDERNEVKLKLIDKEVSVTPMSQDGRLVGHFCGLEIFYLDVSVKT